MTEEQKAELFEALAQRRKVKARDAARRIAALKATAVAEFKKYIIGEADTLAGSDALIAAVILERRKACAESYSAELERALKS